MSDAVLEVKEATFRTEVLDRSGALPVLVDFWAPWCGPCRTLGPILEELAADAGGRWVLAKINADENPELVRSYGVRGIPAVKLFIDGVVADEFTGALPRSEVDEFLKRAIPSRADLLVRDAMEAAERGEREQESELWNAVLAEDPDHDLAHVRRARVLLADGAIDEATRHLESVPADSPLHGDARNLLRLGGWARRIEDRGGLEAIRERAADDPDDVAARYELGCALAVSGDFEGALGEFLEVVRGDRAFEDDAGRTGMLALFTLLGDDHELTREFRGRLSALLF